ncbi:MAG: hypothetical protein Q9172_001919 [Xanthocarpia lactea]
MNAEARNSIQTHNATALQLPHLRFEEDYTLSNGAVVKAIRHEHIRSELLQQAEAILQWTHPQPQGVAPDDRTSPVAYPPDQRNWGWTRALYPPVNFVLERTTYKHPNYEIKDWYHNGRLVLDLEGKPMRRFFHLPDTCSTKIPGGHIEALMRLDDRTTYADIGGRMPPHIVTQRKGYVRIKPLQGVNALSAAAKAFREVAGMLSWSPRAGSDVLSDYIRANLPAALKERNTTRGWRDLTKAEIATVRESTIGSRPQQARKRASSQEAREKREENIKKRKAAANAEREKAAGTNPGDDNNDSSDEDIDSGDEEHDLVYDDHNSGDTDEEGISSIAELLDEAADKYTTMYTDVLDPRLKYPETAEEVHAIRQACAATVVQFKRTLGSNPTLFEPHSYAYQMRSLQQQVDKRYETLQPDEKAPTLVYLTGWPGGIKDWRSARFSDGRTEYQIEENGRVGPPVSQDNTMRLTPVEQPAGEYLVDARGLRVDAQTDNSEALRPTNPPE